MPANLDLSRVIKFTQRADWAEALAEVSEQHIGLALEGLDIDADQLTEILGPDLMSNLFGCAVEDLMTRHRGPGELNFVDDYIKRRGLSEAVTVKAHLRAVRDSAFSLYEVSDIVPGESFLARDLVLGGDPVLVQDRTASQTLQPWDRIGTRIIPQRAGYGVSGIVLLFSREGCEAVLKGLRELSGSRKRSGPAAIPPEVLPSLAPLFTNMWLLDVVPPLLEDAGDGEDDGHGDHGSGGTDRAAMPLYVVHFRLGRGATPKSVSARLDRAPDLVGLSDDVWQWFGPAEAGGDRPSQGAVLIQNRTLKLVANSAERAAAGEAMLIDLLGTSVSLLVTTTSIPEGGLSAQAPEAQSLRAEDASSPFGEPEGITPEFLDQMYRGLLDQPLPALGNKSPRQSTRTPAAQRKLVAWLKAVENDCAHLAVDPDNPVQYDPGWLWDELGVRHLRQ
jgi:hypothetical protein